LSDRGDELDGAGTHELVHHIRGGEATPDEWDLGSFTHRKLKQLPIRDLWLFSKWKQLDTHQDQNIFGVRCPIPPGITVLRSQVQFSQPYASCIDQPCTRLFFALSAAMSFVVMGADCTNAYASAPSPGQPTYARIDDAYADWYRSRHGKEVDRSLVLPGLNASQVESDEPSIYRGNIDRKVLLLCRQVNDLAAACSDPTVAQGLSDCIATVPTTIT
jgi:hypothetical protein